MQLAQAHGWGGAISAAAVAPPSVPRNRTPAPSSFRRERVVVAASLLGGTRPLRAKVGGVLQIVTKMYFRENVPLHSTVHRSVLYTNRWFLPMGTVLDLPVGQLAPSTGSQSVSTVTRVGDRASGGGGS